MKKMIIIVLGPLLAMMLLLFGVTLFNAPPKYQTVPLPVWLAGFDKGAGTQARNDAVSAVRALQLKCIPVLMDYLKVKESKVQRALEKEVNTSFVGMRPANPIVLQERAVAAFEVLGTNAAPAIPDLAALLDRPDAAENAAQALSFLGSGTVDAFQRGLTNQNANVRAISARALGKYHRQDSLAVLKAALEDSSGTVRGNAAEALRAFWKNAVEIVPSLIPLLSDEDRYVHHMAAETLGSFGPAAVAAVPALKEIVKNEEPGMSPAKNALGRISLEEASAAGLKQVPGLSGKFMRD